MIWDEIRVKVCCIQSLDEALMALELGADLLGLVSEMPSGPGIISLAQIHAIVQELPAEIKTVLLTSKQTAEGVVEQHRATRTWGLQLVDRLELSELRKLRQELPHTILIPVVHVLDEHSVEEALDYEGLADYLLLDSGQPHAAIKILGGTGRSHNWTISERICRASRLPVILAGGLNPHNIGEALHTVRPAGIDLCSGVRTQGQLDARLLNAFFRAVDNATSDGGSHTNVESGAPG